MSLSSHLLITHGDFDGIATAALEAKRLNIAHEDINVSFTQPFTLDDIEIPKSVKHITVCDIAVNNRDPHMTLDFFNRIEHRLDTWYDHHRGWDAFIKNNIYASKQYHFNIAHTYACAQIIIHKSEDNWIVKDAIATDTRQGEISPTTHLIESAIKSDFNNDDVRFAAVKLLMGDKSQRVILNATAEKYLPVIAETNRLAEAYSIDGNIAIVDTRRYKCKYDLTQLLLIGQKAKPFAIAKIVSPITGVEMITIATHSKTNLVETFKLISGSPSRVTIPLERLSEAIILLNSEDKCYSI